MQITDILTGSFWIGVRFIVDCSFAALSSALNKVVQKEMINPGVPPSLSRKSKSFPALLMVDINVSVHQKHTKQQNG